MEYLPWLIKRGCLDGYQDLASVWDEVEFIWYIPEDGDKAEQALRMREEYAYETGHLCTRQGSVTFLELFVSLTDTLTAMVYQDRAAFTRSILLNLGVVNCGDRLLLYPALYSMALDSADRVMHRTYHRNGAGGLFMVPGADILEMPLRDQMILWSNYYDPYR